jgi:uncharacterized PurR-regulated membrane protein YhhQ (DUF165 family)
MIRAPHLPSITRPLREALRRRFGPEPARTAVGVLFAALLLAFYVLYVATHLDR